MRQQPHRRLLMVQGVKGRGGGISWLMGGPFRYPTNEHAERRIFAKGGAWRSQVGDGEHKIQFTSRKPLEILAMEFDPTRSRSRNGYLEKGSS